jgi:pilus assembly protein Flp/PilA
MTSRFPCPTCPRARQRGQGLVEYAVIMVLVAIVLVVVLTLMGRQIQDVFQNVANTLTGP